MIITRRVAWLHYYCTLVSLASTAAESTFGVIFNDIIISNDDKVVAHDQTEYASCDGCFCVTTGNAPCPEKPNSAFNASVVTDILRSQIAINPYSLDCNPYEEDACQMVPQQNGTLVAMGDRAVCGIRYEPGTHYFPRNEGTQSDAHELNMTSDLGAVATDGDARSSTVRNQECPTYYRMVSYENFDSASSDGAVITHAGGKSCQGRDIVYVLLQVICVRFVHRSIKA